jgi:hypothetical protein
MNFKELSNDDLLDEFEQVACDNFNLGDNPMAEDDFILYHSIKDEILLRMTSSKDITP